MSQVERVTRINQLRRRLAESGGRITPQRLAILDALVYGKSHPTAEQIHEQVLRTSPTTSLATVYKTLDTLKSLGEVRELELGDDSHHFDALNPSAHPHVMCTRCGRIEDVELPEFSELSSRASAASGFQITGEKLEFLGICRDCQN